MRARDPDNSRKTEMADSWPVCPFLKLEAACISWENDSQIFSSSVVNMNQWMFIPILICAVVTETDKSWKGLKDTSTETDGQYLWNICNECAY